MARVNSKASDKVPPKKMPSKAAPIKTHPKFATPESETPSANAKKRKIDWATIDDKKPFQGFKLEAVKPGSKTARTSSALKKQKTGSVDAYGDAPLDAESVQKNPFLERPLSNAHYLVKPSLEWESTQRYRKFTINDAEFEVGQIVFIKTTEAEFDPTNMDHFAVGRVLEVRAGDAAHVYLRIYYLYKPEELPEGREPHHGDCELIASNHMDIIEALTVADKADVMHWEEDPDKSDWPLKDQLFWRQTFDLGKPKGQQFSELRSYCIDEAPCNPDEPLVNCSSCKGWLHARCLEKQAVEDAYKEHDVEMPAEEPAKAPPTKGKKKGARRSSAKAKPEPEPAPAPAFAAHLTTHDSGQVCLTVTDKRPEEDNKRWNVDVHCLLCKAVVEKAAAELPEPLVEAAEVTKVVEDEVVTSRPEPQADEEEDSVVSKDEETPEAPASDAAVPDADGEPTAPDPVLLPKTAATNVPAKRGRGRPRKQRLGEMDPDASITVKEAKAEPLKQSVGQAKGRGRPPVLAKVKSVDVRPSVQAGATPLTAAPANESVFQSGLRSVRRLLFRTA